MSFKKIAVTGVVLAFELFFIVYLIPGNIVWICLAIGAGAALYFLFMASKAKRTRTLETSKAVNILPVLSTVLPFVFGWLTLYLGYFSPVLAILLTALTIDLETTESQLNLLIFLLYDIAILYITRADKKL